MNVTALSNRVGWFGKYTGYEQVSKYYNGTQTCVNLVEPKDTLLERLIGKTYSFHRKWPARNQSDAAAELRFSISHQKKQSVVYHILYTENHLLFLDCWKKSPSDIVGTVHLPPSQWQPAAIENLKRLSSAIVLYQRDLGFFENYIGQGRVKFVHHGVDTDFFRPAQFEMPAEKRLLFAGCYLRNTEMLLRIIHKMAFSHPELRFDLLIPQHFFSMPGLSELRNHPAVTWHQGLSDEALRELYQKSYLLLLPMNESGANTAIVESLACGLPVVTTDVGGIRDYGGGSLYPVVVNNDDDAMLELIEQYLNETAWRNGISGQCRKFAQETLDWNLIAQKHLEAYGELIA